MVRITAATSCGTSTTITTNCVSFTTTISKSNSLGNRSFSNPPLNPRISAKFTNNDIQILRQLLLAGEKHKWKQITKELNSSTNHNAHIVAAISAAAIKSRSLVNNYDSNNNINDNTPTTNLHHSFGYHHLQQQQHSLEQKSLGHRVGNGTTGSSSSVSSGSISGNSPSTIPAKNVSPTFVVKQYQQLLGLLIMHYILVP